MKAMIRDRYGPPDVLRIAEVDPPELPPDAALVRVRATSVNAYDWHMLRGTPYFARFETGLRGPKERILGLDVAGVVEQAGTESPLEVGQRVVGSRSGAWAELVAGRNLVPMPGALSFADAAALPVAGVTASRDCATRADCGRVNASSSWVPAGAWAPSRFRSPAHSAQER